MRRGPVLPFWCEHLSMPRAAAAAVVTALGLGAAAAPAQTPVYELAPTHSFVHFEVLHFGTSTIRGRIGPVAGSVEFDAAARRGWVGVRVPMRSVDTGLAVFDARLKQPDLLAVDAHAEAYFVAADWRFDGERPVELRGELTWRGRSQPLALRVLRFACRDDVRARTEVCGSDFDAELNRSDFGVVFGLPFVADRVRLVIQAEGTRR